ncbi:MAG: cupin domain-containing protein [Candidatus Beckwithbacteria bacterium]
MKIIHKNQTKEFNNSDQCLAIEYPLGDKDINGAVIKLNGRYPNKGQVVNAVCKEMAYIIKGSGKVVVDGQEINFFQGDLILINKNEKYYWQGNCEMFVPCVPAWYPEQHREID